MWPFLYGIRERRFFMMCSDVTSLRGNQCTAGDFRRCYFLLDEVYLVDLRPKTVSFVCVLLDRIMIGNKLNAVE